MSDEALLAAAADAPNMRQLLRSLGVAAYGGNYESIRRRLDRLEALPEHLRRRSRCELGEVSDDALAAAVAGAVTLADAFRALGYANFSSLYKPLHRRLREAGIDTSHLLGRGLSRGRPGKFRIPLEAVLVRDSSFCTHDLRLRLLREGVMQHVCACCQRSEWRGQPIPLELDHIDGDRTNNELSNLRLLCPNCHAQTETYRGRNIGRPHQASRAFEQEGARARNAALERLGRIVTAA